VRNFLKLRIKKFGRSVSLRAALAATVFVAVLIAIGGTTLLRAADQSVEKQSGGEVVELKLEGEVAPILANYVDEGLADAAQRHAALVLITMDTPGGLTDSMKEIIQHILASPVPVAVYVSPTGSRGASAGFYILLSADVAAMAPGTHTGAASPVIMIGGYVPQIDETMRKKINNDAMAFLRSFSERRGRNPVLAETAITDAKAFTEKEALEAKMIDLVAASKEDLLRQLNGKTITRFDGTKVTLALEHSAIRPFELSQRQKFLALIVRPDAFFILLLIAVMGLHAEFTHPGAVAPGVVGGIAAILALYAMHLLPVNYAGLFLILLGLAFFILEAKFTSHGVLGTGGVIAMVLGAMFLIRSPLTNGGVSLFLALAATLPFALITVFLMRLVLRSRKWKSATGIEELIGEPGVVVSALQAGAEGLIRIHGELWGAVSSRSAPEGATVRVLRVEGLKLFVEPEQLANGTAGGSDLKPVQV
jgi:membrane-bound serine protease (ClpP class)